MTGEAPPLIDTNILVYLFDEDAANKRDISHQLIAGCFKSERRYSLSYQNLAEFSVVVTEKVADPMPSEDIQRFIHTITSYQGWNLVHYTGTTIIHAHEIKEQHKLHFWDALLAATMLENHIHTIYTEDAHFRKVPGITMMNPYQTQL